ncbi:MAG TPA: lipopolysaccharide assembly protein LapA domain-containing protein [Acidimicrobiia bacterium]|nr:lipopolysaccharide assembly protein LapA domain-containing protein [Acidimicrobiia bacterium]
MTDNLHAPRPDRPNRWIGPTILLAMVTIVIVVFVTSNTDRVKVGFAGFDWENVRLWLVIVVALVAGGIGSRLLGWAWHGWRRRRRRLADELDTLRRHAADPGD